MEEINLFQFEELYTKYECGDMCFTCGGRLYRIELRLHFEFFDDGRVDEKRSFELYEGETLKEQFDSCGQLINYVKENFAEDSLFTITRLYDFDSVEAYKAYREFEHISMAGLLSKYEDCDEFSLTCPYNDGYDRAHPNGVYHLDPSFADSAYKALERETYKTCLAQYGYATEEEKGQLPDFDVLYADIIREVEGLYARRRKRPLFPCDMYSEGKMKYKQEISCLWHIYNAAGVLQDSKENLAAQVNNTLTRPLDCEFGEEKYVQLKPYITRTEVTYCWHCTTSGSLSKVFYIQLNDVTRAWLLQFKDDYDFNGLDDLAFYKNGELRFSSCTHEGFHNDIKP